MAPSLWLLGAPGTRQFDKWVDVKTGQILFTVALVMIGVDWCLYQCIMADRVTAGNGHAHRLHRVC
jgi:hypothetical protein